VQKSEGMITLYDVLVNGRELRDAICKTEMDCLELVPADTNLIGVNRGVSGRGESRGAFCEASWKESGSINI